MAVQGGLREVAVTPAAVWPSSLAGLFSALFIPAGDLPADYASFQVGHGRAFGDLIAG